MTPKTKEPIKLYELLYPTGEVFRPSKAEMELVDKTILIFRRSQQDRDRAFAYFDGMTLVSMIEDSVERFNTNLYLRDGMEDWQAGFNDGFIRNKVLAVVGKLVEQLPIATAIPRGEEDVLRAQLITDLYQYTEELDDYENHMAMFILELIVKGTAIGYEDIEYKKKKIRNVKGMGDAMRVTEETIKTTKFYSEIVPLEEYYPASVGIMGVEAQPYCFRRKIMDVVEFKDKYGHYKKAGLVSGLGSAMTAGGTVPYYLDFLSSDVAAGQVELIRFYDVMNDEYVMLANGIWINPMGNKEIVQPLPWNHKQSPFYSAINEPYGVFFYGKSLPNRLSAMQDILNVLQNMMMDQSFLSIFTPILTAGFDGFEDDYLRPGRRTSIDTGGVSLSNAIMPLQFPTPTGWHQYILEYTRRIMEESALVKPSSGVAGQGERTTAFEIQTAAAGVAAILTMVARYLNAAIKRKANLRVKNILQFGFQPNSTIVPGVLADTDVNKAFATFSFANTKLSSGKRGTRVLELYRSDEALPSKDETDARAIISSVEQGQAVEVTAISPSYIRNGVDYDIILGLDPKRERSSMAEQGMLLQQIQTLAAIGGQRVNLDEPITKLAIAMGLDPTKIIREEQPQQPAQGLQAGPGGGAGPQAMGAANQQLAQSM